MNTCDTCKWWARYSTAHDVGTCRRNAPFDAGKMRGLPRSMNGFDDYFGTNRDWPQTLSKDWCGKFEKKAPTEPQQIAEQWQEAAIQGGIT